MYKWTFLLLIILIPVSVSSETLYLEESEYFEKDDKYIEADFFTEGIDIICLPKDRDVYINKRFKGTSPLTLDLEKGSYKLTLMENSRIIVEEWILVQKDKRLIRVFDDRIRETPTKDTLSGSDIPNNSREEQNNLSYRIDSSLYLPGRNIDELTLQSTFDLAYRNRAVLHLSAEKELWSDTEDSENLKQWETGLRLNEQPLNSVFVLNGYLQFESRDDYYITAGLSAEAGTGMIIPGLYSNSLMNLEEGSVEFNAGIILKINSRYARFTGETGWSDGFRQSLQIMANPDAVFRPYLFFDYTEEETITGAGFMLGAY